MPFVCCKARLDDSNLSHLRSDDEKEEVDVVVVHEPVQFIGLTKEELEKYRNDPFWRRLRMFLFVLFWLAWLAMFVLAILIVIISPKCPPKIIPEWWQRKVSYEAWVPSMQDSDGDGMGDLKGLNERLDSLRRIGITTVRMAPVVHAQSALGGYDVLDAAAVDPKFGEEEDFVNLVEDIHWNDMFAVIDLPLTVTSANHEWVLKSGKGEAGYDDFYHWHTGSDASIDFHASHPEVSGKSYFHVGGAANEHLAVLNWRSERVKNESATIIRKWLERGVDGFHVPYADYFGRTPEEPSTLNWNPVLEAFAYIRGVLDEFAQDNPDREPIVLMTSFPNEFGMTDSLKRLLISDAKLNFVMNTDLKQYSDVNVMLNELKGTLDFVQTQNDPTLYSLSQSSDAHSHRAATRLGNSRARGELWNMLLMLMPGSVSVYYGEELVMLDSDQADLGSGLPVWRSPMQWSGEKFAGFTTGDKPYFPVNSDYKEVNFEAQYYNAMTPIKMFRRLAELRQSDDVIMSGWFNVADADVDDKLITFARVPKTELRRGHKIYACALNFDTEPRSVLFDNSTIPLNDGELGAGSIVTVTSNRGATGDLWPRKNVEWPFTLQPEEGVVIRFVKA